MKTSKKTKQVFKLKDIKPYLIYWWHPINYFSIVLTKPKKCGDIYFCEVWFSDDQKNIKCFCGRFNK